LATLSVVLATQTLENLSQFPTLLGFALQSFSSSPWSTNSFELISPLMHFSTKPRGFVPVLQRLSPTGKTVPLFLRPKGLVWVGALAFLGFMTSQALSPSDSQWKHLLSTDPLSFLDDDRFTTATLMNPRVSKPRRLGVFPEGMPACLAFITDCVCLLLER
jgi:hypothetical protein